AAGHAAAGLGVGGALPARCQLGLDHLVQQRIVPLQAEHVARQLGLGGRAQGRCGEGGHQPSVLTSTMPPTDPGTGPAISSRFRSASTSATFRPRWVTRRSPMWPAMRMPLNTRDGVAEAPIEPGLRMLCEPWLLGPLEKLWRLMVPAKPLPLLRPLTLTASPGSNASTVIVSPTAKPSASRNSTRCRCGATPACFRCPTSGLLSVRTCTTGQGPASITVTAVTTPDSWSNSCVMPSFLPMMAFPIYSLISMSTP